MPATDPSLLSLARDSVHRSVSGNRPLLLDGEQSWLILDGSIYLFAVELLSDGSLGKRYYLNTFEAGEVLFAWEKATSFVLLGTAALGTSVVPLKPTESGMDPESGSALAEATLTWLERLSEHFPNAPTEEPSSPKGPGRIELDPGEVLGPRDTFYAVHIEKGSLQHLQLAGDTHEPDDEWVVCGKRIKLEATSPTRCRACTIEEAIEQGNLTALLRSFSATGARVLSQILDAARTKECEQFQGKAKSETEAWNQAFEKAVHALDRATNPTGSNHQEPMLAVVEAVADKLKIPVVPHPDMRKGKAMDDPLEAIAQASHFHTRQVVLEPNWFKEDAGPLIGYLREEGMPVALLPNRKGYRMLRPDTGATVPVDANLSDRLSPMAYTIYRPMPTRKLGLRDIVRFASFGSSNDFLNLLLLSLAVAAIGLFTPWATKQLFDTIIPSAQRDQLLMLTLALFTAAMGSALFQLTRSFALLRIETRADANVQAGIWARLLDLPVPFFGKYSVGDLTQRVLGIQQIRATLSGATTNSLLSSVFSFLQLYMVFKYGGELAFWALLLVLLSLVVSLLSSYFTITYQRRELEVQGRVSSRLYQLLRGIHKLKVAAAERSGYIRWLNPFTEQRRLAYQSGMISNGFTVFHAVFPLASSMLIFFLVHKTLQDPTTAMSAGQFLAFNTAFTALISATLSLGDSVLSILNIIPLWERSKPILKASPEIHDTGTTPPRLKGEVEVNSVTFRYGPDLAPVLQDVSVQLKPGAFAAIVGPSGSGKSSLLRLLLGFEQPESGSIYYDGHDLASLDLRGVRRQIGTVLQNACVLRGDIFTNIVGSAPLSLDDAWEAAERAGFAEDIKTMPMEMHTVIDENGSTLSGGQRQRMIIARALARKPPIIFFDEATSALDNRTQEIVSSSLERLNATRLVIAHRLSTIRRADCIYVLNDGRIVERGDFDTLIKLDGIFAQIASRQVT